MVFLTKLCECGCGQPAPIAIKTRRSWGHIKGLPVRFIRGHARRKLVLSLDRFTVNVATGCWEWYGACNDKGYGQTSWNGKVQYVHRLMYERVYGVIDQNLEIDHLCRNHSCLNPEHLEAVTRSINVLRGDAVRIMNRCRVCNMLIRQNLTNCQRCEKRIVEVEDNSIPSEGLISA